MGTTCFTHDIDKEEIGAAWLDGTEVIAPARVNVRSVRELKEFSTCLTCAG